MAEPATSATVALAGTLDTKGSEYEFLRQRLYENGVSVVLVDTGVLGEPGTEPDVTREEVARAGGAELSELAEAGDRGTAVAAMSRGAGEVVKRLYGAARSPGSCPSATRTRPWSRWPPVLAGRRGHTRARRSLRHRPFPDSAEVPRQLKEMGFSGIQNFPTVGLYDGNFRQNLEETGMGFGLEGDLVRQARELDLLTAPYAFDEGEARRMAAAGADVLVPHVGLTTSGTIGAQTALTLDDSAERVQRMRDAAKEENADTIVLCHGGPIASPDDAAYVLSRTEGVAGFFGASSMERLPTETAMTENMRRFKTITDQEESR